MPTVDNDMHHRWRGEDSMIYGLVIFAKESNNDRGARAAENSTIKVRPVPAALARSYCGRTRHATRVLPTPFISASNTDPISLSLARWRMSERLSPKAYMKKSSLDWKTRSNCFRHGEDVSLQTGWPGFPYSRGPSRLSRLFLLLHGPT